MPKRILDRPNVNASTLDWSSGNVALGAVVDSDNNVFTVMATQKVTVDVNGDFAMLECNEAGRLAVNFDDGDFVLQTGRPRDTLILTFEPPVRAVAAQFAAFGLTNPTRFFAVMQARLDDGSDSTIVRKDGITTGLRDRSAICMGIAVNTGDALIRAVSFSVEPDGPVNSLRRFAINQVTYGDKVGKVRIVGRGGGV